jgi:hypothetical protein
MSVLPSDLIGPWQQPDCKLKELPRLSVSTVIELEETFGIKILLKAFSIALFDCAPLAQRGK